MEAKQAVKLKKADFAQKYFYVFGLNIKYCNGITQYKAKLTEDEKLAQKGIIFKLKLRTNFVSFSVLLLPYTTYIDLIILHKLNCYKQEMINLHNFCFMLFPALNNSSFC